MKSKNLLYIIIGVVLLMACVGLIYISLDAGSNSTENSSKINNTSSINNSNINVTDNNTNNSTNEKPINNIKSPNSPLKKNLPKNLPKNSKLSYSKAYSIANSFHGNDDDTSYKSYVKYTGYEYDKDGLHWKFNMYSKKTNDCLGSFRVSDATGDIDLG